MSRSRCDARARRTLRRSRSVDEREESVEIAPVRRDRVRRGAPLVREMNEKRPLQIAKMQLRM